VRLQASVKADGTVSRATT